MPFFNKVSGGSARKFGLSRGSRVPVSFEYLLIAGGGGGRS